MVFTKGQVKPLFLVQKWTRECGSVMLQSKEPRGDLVCVPLESNLDSCDVYVRAMDFQELYCRSTETRGDLVCALLEANLVKFMMCRGSGS